MSSTSLESVLQWLRAHDRLFGWDAIVALDRGKLNALLAQEYIRRFNTQSFLEPVNGELSVSNESKTLIHDFLLAHPRLSFENADLFDAKARLRMAVIGGNQLGLRKDVSHWYVQRLDWIGPLAGPELRLDLRLDDVPGDVSAGGAIMLDLSKSDNFTLTFSNQEEERELGGNFFKELFQRLPDEQRVWPLGSIASGNRPLLRPESFKLRTQAKPASALAPAAEGSQEGDGAMLAFIRMHKGLGGSMPDSNSDFRYLIPDKGTKDFSAAGIFNARRLILEHLLGRLTSLMIPMMPSGLRYQIDADSKGVLTGASEFWGVISSPMINATVPISLGPSHLVEIDMETLRGPVSALPLRVEVDDDGARVTWLMKLNASAKMLSLRDNYNLHTADDFPDLKVVNINKDITCLIAYRRADRQGGAYELSSFIFDGLEEASPGGLEASNTQSLGLRKGLGDFHKNFIRAIYHYAIRKAVEDKVVGLLREKLAMDLNVDQLLEPLVKETLHFNFGNAFVGDEVHGAKAIAVFGNVSPDGNNFAVHPMEPVLQPGGTLQFKVEPPVNNVRWQVDALQVFSDEVGSIDPDGTYHAPFALGFKGGFTQVRITATDPITAVTRSALVTVVDHAIALSPLLEVTAPGESLELTAGNGGTVDIEWSFANANPHGRLADPDASGAANTYIAGADSRTDAFKVDVITVRNKGVYGERSTCVVTRMKRKKPMPVTPEEWGSSIETDWVRPALWVGTDEQKDVEWSVVYGPGTISQDRYEVKRNSRDRFAVVAGRVQSQEWGDLEGFIILPLPLDASIEAYEAQSSVTRRRRLATSTQTSTASTEAPKP
ncbi:hypothetical protein V7V80_17095 [Pseudomonas kermanshahensis]|uniref:Ig-like domain-containing protein n=1 Tax=Pseudomonas kermanshahensis TaxID=2745482 RepID=A0ABU8R945_9PSED